MLLEHNFGWLFPDHAWCRISGKKKGYAYGIGSFNVSLPPKKLLELSPPKSVTDIQEATIEEIFKKYTNSDRSNCPAEELNLVKNYLYGGLLRRLGRVIFIKGDSLKHKLWILRFGRKLFISGSLKKIDRTPEADTRWPTNIGTLKRCISSLPDNLNLPGVKGRESAGRWKYMIRLV